ncbi:MAG: hypothetical protein JOZ57_00510, partial [Abitibacteriaceae bacterium]|nr:hypothetical protein [Abditibacteriaceae bacterium]
IKTSGVPSSAFRQGVEQIPGKVLFFLDSCHSGNVLGKQPLDTTGAVNELSSAENGVVVYTAAEGHQVALEDPEWNNGAFTKALIEGVKGNADFFHNGKISVAGLELYIAQSVQTLTQGNQTPTTCKPKTMPDFTVALKK